jgi:hypothetical protein
MRVDALVAALVVPLVACGPDAGTRELTVGPMDEFVHGVAPVLEARCAHGGCHGRPDRPFALFAPGVYRLDPSRTHLAEDLSPREHELNAARIAAWVDPLAPDDSLVLEKPLASGAFHGGGEVFAGETDPDYVVLRDWLRACVLGRDAGAP